MSQLRHRKRTRLFGGGVFLFATFLSLTAVVFMLSMSILANNRGSLFQVRGESGFLMDSWSVNALELTKGLMLTNTARQLGTTECDEGELDLGNGSIAWGPVTINGANDYSLIRGSFTDADRPIDFEVTVLRCLRETRVIDPSIALVDDLTIGDGDLYIHTRVTTSNGFLEEHDYVMEPRANSSLAIYANNLTLNPLAGASLEVDFAQGTSHRLLAESDIVIGDGVRFLDQGIPATLQGESVTFHGQGNTIIREDAGASSTPLSSSDFSRGDEVHRLQGGTFAVLGTGSGAQLVYYNEANLDKDQVNNQDPDLEFSQNIVYDNNGVAGTDTSVALEFRPSSDGSKYELIVRGEVSIEGDATFLNATEYDLDIVLGEGDDSFSSLEVTQNLIVGGNLEGTGNVIAGENLTFSGQSIVADDSGRGLGLHAEQDITVLPVGSGSGSSIETDDGDWVYEAASDGPGGTTNSTTSGEVSFGGFSEFEKEMLNSSGSIGGGSVANLGDELVSGFYTQQNGGIIQSNMSAGGDNIRVFMARIINDSIFADYNVSASESMVGELGLDSVWVGVSPGSGWPLSYSDDWPETYDDYIEPYFASRVVLDGNNYGALTVKDYFSLRVYLETAVKDYVEHNGVSNNVKLLDALQYSHTSGLLSQPGALNTIDGLAANIVDELQDLAESNGADTLQDLVNSIGDDQIEEEVVAAVGSSEDNGPTDLTDLFDMRLSGLLSAGGDISANNNGNGLEALGFFFAGADFDWTNIGNLGNGTPSSLTFDQSLALRLLDPSALDYSVAFYR